MKNILLNFAVFVVFMIDLSVQQRISETKCAEYSRIQTTRTNPHLVWIRAVTPTKVVNGLLGALISDEFVITSALSTLIPSGSKVYFSSDEEYNVAERFTHPFYSKTAHYNVGLLRLERRVNLNGNHRPACLWGQSFFEDTSAQVMKWESNEIFLKKLDMVTGYDCTYLHQTQNDSLFCLKPTNTADNKYKPATGSPIQVWKSNNNYIIGIFSFYYQNENPHIIVGTKINDYLDWIEQHVWQRQYNTLDPDPDIDVRFTETCGKVLVGKPLATFAQPTYHGEFPWHVALYRNIQGVRKYKCGGTILNENIVLTAAHCITDETGDTPVSQLVIKAGAYDVDVSNFDSQEVGINKIIKHKDYNRNYMENDIAILKLLNNLKYSNYIQPICIPDDISIFTSPIGIVAGWGKNERDVFEKQLFKASLPIVSNAECRSSNRNFFTTFLNDGNFCAAYRNGTNVCSGDSGSGFIFENNSKWYLRGIVSLAVALPDERCDITEYTLFTNVDKFTNWISQNS